MARVKIPSDIPKDGKLPVTKLDAAVRQLETAITLWFADGDPVSICTLSAAAHEIIDSLNAGFGGSPTMLQGHNIRPEMKDLALALFRQSPNFFKHGGKDPHETHFFSVKGQVAMLADAVATYNSWKIGKRPIFEVFIGWLLLSQPNFFMNAAEVTNMTPPEAAMIVRAGKLNYYNMALAVQTRKLAGV
ncbi:hypothetical protein OPIT5_06100 [Opitutaceae bacterium TAV5]|nr:hypothetical protein OPIT5_06100 [Opitutaceae bacterium TAV5]